MSAVAGLVLAGGRGTRLGAHVPKPLVELGGRPMIGHVLDRFPPWIAPLMISANDAAAFAAFGLPVLADRAADFQGPLAGLEAAAAWLLREHPLSTHVLALPGDTPMLPRNLARRMAASLGPRPCIAVSAGRAHPTVGLWPVAVLAALEAHLASQASRSLMRFAAATGFEAIDFDDADGHAFLNVNTPEELAAARTILDR